MAYYDPRGWIAPDDRLVSNVETRLMLQKQVRPKRSSAGKSLLPPSAMELDVIIKQTDEVLRLTEWVDNLDRVFIDLTSSGDVFRKGHFNHDWHHNPNGRDIPPPHHIHFPTVKYSSLKRKPSYAHPIKAESDYLDALISFCDCANIELHGISLPLIRRC